MGWSCVGGGREGCASAPLTRFRRHTAKLTQPRDLPCVDSSTPKFAEILMKRYLGNEKGTGNFFLAIQVRTNFPETVGRFLTFRPSGAVHCSHLTSQHDTLLLDFTRSRDNFRSRIWVSWRRATPRAYCKDETCRVLDPQLLRAGRSPLVCVSILDARQREPTPTRTRNAGWCGPRGRAHRQVLTSSQASAAPCDSSCPPRHHSGAPQTTRQRLLPSTVGLLLRATRLEISGSPGAERRGWFVYAECRSVVDRRCPQLPHRHPAPPRLRHTA